MVEVFTLLSKTAMNWRLHNLNVFDSSCGFSYRSVVYVVTLHNKIAFDKKQGQSVKYCFQICFV